VLCSLSDSRSNNSSKTVEAEDDELHHDLHESHGPDVGIKSAEDFGVCGKADGEEIDDSDEEERLTPKAEVHKRFIPFPNMTEAEKEKHIHTERYQPAD